MPDEITLPEKRVEGETVEDRLTEAVRERVLPARYLLRDESGQVTETPAELFERVANRVASAEEQFGNDPETWADRFESLMANLEFVPNSPTMMNAGTDREQLAACFVISPDDDLDSIFETVHDAARIFQTGGGVGYSFSQLRPQGDVVRAGGHASGPVSFMGVFDEMCEAVKSGGKRRGAQMGILRVDHPDIGRFCVAKREEGELSNFNISVAVTEEFAAAVEADDTYTLYNPRTGEPFEVVEQTARFYNAEFADHEGVEENLWRDHGDVEGIEEFRGDLLTVGEPMELPARLVWRLVVDGAWETGEPGVFLVDQANADHSFDLDEHPDHRIRATNPCGEQPLERFEACNLGHVNLSLLVQEDAPAYDGGDVDAFLDDAVDHERLDRIARQGTRFLDDVVTVSDFPLEDIEETVGELRKVGLGVMGFAELLAQLGIPYGSDASVEVADRLMGRIERVSSETSHALAAERGAFPAYAESKYADPSRYPDWFRQHTGLDPEDHADGYPVRNHGTTSVAPTGTTSMIANTSPGCEPFYDVVYAKNVGRDVRGGELLVRFDDYFERVLDANGYDPDEVRDEAEELIRNDEYEGPDSLSVPAELTEPFVRATDVAPEDHVRVQAAFQRGVDGAVSKTVHLSHDASREDVGDVLETAIESDCKGVTLYREASREEQVLSTSEGEQSESSE